MVTVTKHILVGGDGKPVSMTCALATEILKNKVLTLSDPFTVAEVAAGTSATGILFAGISAADHEANEGTQISVITDGIFKVYASGNITVGAPLRSCGAGYFAAAAAADVVSGAICGKALETATTGETMLAWLKAA